MNKETVQAISLIANKFPTSTSITSAVNDLNQGELIDAALSTAQVADGLAKYAGKSVPGINVAALGNDSVKIISGAVNNGTISTSDALSLASTLTAMAGTAALGAAVGAGAVAAAPVAVAVGVAALTASAALTLASVKADGSIDVSGHVDAIKSAAQKLSDRFGELYETASGAISSALEKAGSSLTDIIDSLADGFIRGALGLGDWLNEVGDAIKDGFDRAKNWVWPRDPIILDLDSDGLETVGLNANIHFDHDGDGVLTRTGWTGKDDALLVWDRNANGTIDTGADLFGDFTVLPNGTLAPNGFAALAALDSNGDGILDAFDPAFAELKLWRDASQDGQTGSGELISLADAGIVSLNLANTLKNQNLANGNQLTREGTFTRADSTTSAMGEFKLATDTFDTKFANEIEVPETLKTLPTMGGTGNVRELQQAAAQSGSVAGVLAQFQGATTRAEQKALLDSLITAWAETSGMARSLEARAAGKCLYGCDVGDANDKTWRAAA